MNPITEFADELKVTLGWWDHDLQKEKRKEQRQGHFVGGYNVSETVGYTQYQYPFDLGFPIESVQILGSSNATLPAWEV